MQPSRAVNGGLHVPWRSRRRRVLVRVAGAGGVFYNILVNAGLTSKLDCLAGELSGGQRRKLSVGIAFMGNPAVVFLGRCWVLFSPFFS